MIQNTTTSDNSLNMSSQSPPAFSGLIRSLRKRCGKSDSDPVSIGFTSFQSKEGVSNTCIQTALSIYFETEQDVLIIGANPQDNYLQKILGVATHGLNQVIEGEATLHEAIIKSQTANIHLCTSGVGSQNTFSPFLISRFPAVLEQVKQLFRVVIVDLPPLEMAGHATSIAANLDTNVLVLDPSMTRKEKALEAKQNLLRAGAQVAGVIVNKFET